MMKRILQISIVSLLAFSAHGATNQPIILSIEDPTSPLKKQAIVKRNLKTRELEFRNEVKRWNKSEIEKSESIKYWEEDQLRKEMERFTLWSGGAIYEKQVGVFVFRFGTWGEKDGASLFRIEW